MKNRSHTKLIIYCLIAIGLIAYGTQRVFSQSGDLLDIVKEGSKISSDSFRTGTGSIAVHRWALNNNGGVSESDTVYKVSFVGDRFRLSEEQTIVQNTPGTGEDGKLLMPAGKVLRREIAYDGSKVIVYYPDEKAANIIANPPVTITGVSYWGTISPAACGYGKLTFSKGNATARKDTVDGDDFIVVDWSTSSSSVAHGAITTTWKGWIDPDKGYSVREFKVYGVDEVTNTSPVLVEEGNTEARKYGSGIWGPGKFTRVSYRPSKTGEVKKTSLIEVVYDPAFKLDVPVDAADMALNLPSGTKVTEEMLDGKYIQCFGD